MALLCGIGTPLYMATLKAGIVRCLNVNLVLTMSGITSKSMASSSEVYMPTPTIIIPVTSRLIKQYLHIGVRCRVNTGFVIRLQIERYLLGRLRRDAHYHAAAAVKVNVD